ncbi:MBOAT family O-acyltransferase [Flavimaricola marinus]|uniref:Probable alginate O-acetylase AlgI n=1 Tax=Flavimaricola marinus TaxID=1819565 RepID=A0A238LDG0_9RHOB|nr:MBOAT family protein [Flavimaricola marinus]SMY07651.1 Peptidoglycan O-acetyltransferase [Flavimaricola marinus]
MVFSSQIFIFAFLPLFLGAYYLAPKRWRSLLILLASYVFYGWWKVEYLSVVLGISLISYIAANRALAAPTASARSWAVRIGVGLDLAVLGYFKYSYFLQDNMNSALSMLGVDPSPAVQIVLPIGISFLTFQSISYILDVARKDAPPARNLVDFLAFSALFPQLIAGPVLRYKDLSDQFSERTHSLALFAKGIRRFVIGLAMKLLIADTVSPMVDRMFALSSPTFAEAWLGALAYAIQLLFDFAGYSAMAIGLGLMIGFRFVENFDAPYTAKSVTEFWRRWHISLSNWLRDYLYVPLGGNRDGALRTYRNLMLTMVLGGLWHGANWTFVLWGAWHGLFLSIERLLGSKHRGAVWPRHTGWLISMTVVVIGWVMFRASSVEQALIMYAGMSGQTGFWISAETIYFNQPIEFAALLLGAGIAIYGPRIRQVRLPALAAVTPTMLLLVCTVVMQARTHSPFLYFQF